VKLLADGKSLKPVVIIDGQMIEGEILSSEQTQASMNKAVNDAIDAMRYVLSVWKFGWDK
jgi:hypothetical protein